jgi:nucleoside-diphosphate-sugar epimerase
VSSIAVYGERPDEADETTTPRPTTVYGASKLAAEQLVSQWQAADQRRSATILRPCVVYGERNTSNMLKLIRQVDSGLFVLFGSGHNIKAIAYVGNLVDAMAMLVGRSAEGLHVYNYADKPDQTAFEIVSTIRRALGKQQPLWRLPLWTGRLAALPFDATSKLTGWNLPVSWTRVRKLAQQTAISSQKIRNAGYRQMIDPKEGLCRTVRHYQAQTGQIPGFSGAASDSVRH